jgi:GAF domain-containing protein
MTVTSGTTMTGAGPGSRLSTVDPDPVPAVRQKLGRHGRQQLDRLRMLSIKRFGLLTAGDEERFDRIVRRAQETFDTSAASIALITENQQILKSFVGPLTRTLDRRHTFCNLTIQGEDLLIIPDTLEDPRFNTSPLVVGDPRIRFYAGCPLRGPAGWIIGTLCVIDQAPRTFTIENQQALRALALNAELELNHHR